MNDETGQPTQVLGEAGETCRECGAPLAVDQRYCLNCGRRRGEPRVDLRKHLPGAGRSSNGTAPRTVAAVPPAPPPSAEKSQRDYAPLAAVGGIAVLGLMLLVGVLIGKGGSDSASTPAPQVVRLGEGDAGAESGAGASKSKQSGGSKSKGSGGKKAKSADSAKGLAGGGNAVEASDQALRELQEQSPEEYQESSAKLPDEISTGGAPPPEDNKAPGGGSKGTAIE